MLISPSQADAVASSEPVSDRPAGGREPEQQHGRPDVGSGTPPLPSGTCR